MIEYIEAKTIVTKAQYGERWFGMDYNMNIYKGCNHGYIYCDSRSDCYRIDNFDTVRAKKDALRIIRDELRKKSKGVICSGAMSDPYNQFDKELKLTAMALELINANRFGVALCTKSPLVTRDIPVLEEIKEHSPVIVKLTITTADDEFAKKIEPNTTVSSLRFDALSQLSRSGIFCGVMMMPMLPFICDTEENVNALFERAIDSGVKFIYPAFGMTLRGNQRMYYLDKVAELFGTDIKNKYIRCYKDAYQCTSHNAKKLYDVLVEKCKRYNILYRMPDIVHAYKSQYKKEQLSFLDILNHQKS